jgi:hypothetical protein
MSHEIESKFGFTCPNSTANFYICEDKPIQFVGCCNVDPCKTDDGDCPDGELEVASFDKLKYDLFVAQDCVSDRPEVEWFTCAEVNSDRDAFVGCCAEKPCGVGCPADSLRAARLSSDPDLAANLLPEEDGGLSTGAMAGIGVGAAAGGIALISVGFWWFKRRKRQQETASTYEPYAGQHGQGPQSPHHTVASTPLDHKFGQPSPYASTFATTPSMHHHQQMASWDGSQSATGYGGSPYLPGQSPPIGQNGFQPSPYTSGDGISQYQQGMTPLNAQHMGYQQQQQQQHYQPAQELSGAGDTMRASELAHEPVEREAGVTQEKGRTEDVQSPTLGHR